MISGKAFADCCQWIVDDRYSEKPFKYFAARTGDWVFMNADYLERFVQSIPKLMRKKFRIVLHNSDKTLDLARLSLVAPVAIQIYSINTSVAHPMLKTIPIGFSDSSLRVLPLVDRTPRERTIEIYSNFSTGTNRGARQACLDALADDPRVVRKEPNDRDEYYRDLCNSKFVVCPEGTGIDTHRLYEALWCGATPVVLHSSLDALYQKMPVCIVNDWKDSYFVVEGTTQFDAAKWLA